MPSHNGIADTGPEAAQHYRIKHRLLKGSGASNAGRGSNIRKIQRAWRIEQGLRPLRYPTLTKREVVYKARASDRAAAAIEAEDRKLRAFLKDIEVQSSQAEAA